MFSLDQHMDRFYESIHGAALHLPWSKSETSDWLYASLKKSGFKDALLRLMAVYGKDNNIVLVLFVRQFKGHPDILYRKGVHVGFTSVRKDAAKSSFPQIKSNQYTASVNALVDMTGFGFHEIIFLDSHGFVAEGTVSNITIVKNHELFTAGPRCGILEGVTREVVAEVCRSLRIGFHEQTLTRHDLYNADEAFLTTTLSELMPITRCDYRTIGRGRPGPVTRRVHNEFRNRVLLRGR